MEINFKLKEQDYQEIDGAIYNDVRTELVDARTSKSIIDQTGSLELVFALINNINNKPIHLFANKFTYDKVNVAKTYGGKYTVANFLQTNVITKTVDGEEIQETQHIVVPFKLFQGLRGIADGSITNMVPIIRDDIYGVPFFDVKPDGFGEPSMQELFAIIDNLDIVNQQISMTAFPLFGVDENGIPNEIGGVEILDDVNLDFNPFASSDKPVIVENYQLSAHTVSSEIFKKLWIENTFRRIDTGEPIGKQFELDV